MEISKDYLDKQFKANKEYFDHKFESIDNKFAGIDSRFESIDKKFDGIDNRLKGIDKKFDGIDKRFEDISRKFEGMEIRFEGMEIRFEGMEIRMGGVEKRMVGVEKSMGGLVTKNGFDKKIATLATKHDLDVQTREFKGYVHESFTAQQVFMDEHFNEMVENMQINERLSLHDGWIHKVADKAGVSLK